MDEPNCWFRRARPSSDPLRSRGVHVVVASIQRLKDRAVCRTRCVGRDSRSGGGFDRVEQAPFAAKLGFDHTEVNIALNGPIGGVPQDLGVFTFAAHLE